MSHKKIYFLRTTNILCQGIKAYKQGYSCFN